MIASFEVTEISCTSRSLYAYRIECTLSNGSKLVLTGKGSGTPQSIASHRADVYLSWQLWNDVTGTFAIEENITIPRLEAYLLDLATRKMIGEQ